MHRLHTMNDTRLYFVALVPDEPLLSKVREIKEYMAMQYQSKAALRSPAHITLHMPFQWREDREERLIHCLQEVAQANRPFELTLKDFNAFKPRVIYIDVSSSSALQDLFQQTERHMRRQLNIMEATWRNQPFHPHMTVAFRDLRPVNFDEAWKEFKLKSFEEQFHVKDICLLKHENKQWQVHQRVSLESL